jgi:hypothetical protein
VLAVNGTLMWDTAVLVMVRSFSMVDIAILSSFLLVSTSSLMDWSSCLVSANSLRISAIAAAVSVVAVELSLCIAVRTEDTVL